MYTFALILASLVVLTASVLPINKQCNPNVSGNCRRGDWIAGNIASCKYTRAFNGSISCDAINDSDCVYSWTVDLAKENRCKPTCGKQFLCGDTGTDTRCVCSDYKLPFNECKCQYWPPESNKTCTGYYCGGRSDVHHWACCNNCKDSDKSCAGRTWQGGSSEDYCLECGNQTESAGGREKYFFNCGNCNIQQMCSDRCSTLFNVGGLCWKWLDCFQGCCDLNQESTPTSFCGDDSCDDETETPESCPIDCCFKLNVTCSSSSQCTDECCGTPTCCATENNETRRDFHCANDPHFFIPLPNGDNLCYSIQGQPDFMFSLIKDKYVQLNAQFVLPASDESNTIANVSTFLGNLGLIVTCPVTGNTTVIKVSAQDHSVKIDSQSVVLGDKTVSVLVKRDFKVIITTNGSMQKKKYEPIWLYIDLEFGFGMKIRFYKKHLDLIVTKHSILTNKSDGLMGQFMGKHIEIDANSNIMKISNHKPISVVKHQAWQFLGIDEECWHGESTDNQGGGVIEGTYFDYIVEEILSSP